MNTSIKTKNIDEIAYFVMIISQSKDGSVHYDGYQESDPEKDELTQILSYIVDEDWETASTYSECYTLLRNQIKDLLRDDFEDTESFKKNLDDLVIEICSFTKGSIVRIEISYENEPYRLEVSDEEIAKIFRSWQQKVEQIMSSLLTESI